MARAMAADTSTPPPIRPTRLRIRDSLTSWPPSGKSDATFTNTHGGCRDAVRRIFVSSVSVHDGVVSQGPWPLSGRRSHGARDHKTRRIGEDAHSTAAENGPFCQTETVAFLAGHPLAVERSRPPIRISRLSRDRGGRLPSASWPAVRAGTCRS